MPHFAASDLVFHCLPMSHKKDTRLIWVNDDRFLHLSKINFILKGTISVSNGLDPDHNQHSVSAYLGPSCLQRVSATNKVTFSRQKVKTI